MRLFVKSAMAVGLAGGLALAAMSAANADYYGPYGYSYGYGAYAYAPGYGAYAYAPGYAAPVRRGYRAYGYAGDLYTTQSWPPHHDPGAGYNSNTTSPFKDRKLQGYDY
jgi:hypothetical protein